MNAGLRSERTLGNISRRRSRYSGGFALILCATLLAGCQNTEIVTHSVPEDGYRTRYPIVIAEAPVTMDIPVGLGTAGLSASTRDSIRAFAGDAAENGTGSLVIMAPSGSANEAAAGYVAQQIRNEVRAGGLPNALVEARTYRVADSSVSAPIRLAYSRIKAVSPPCGRWEGSVFAANSASDGAEFGCSTQANLAAMVSNPNDLITPRAKTPASATRRAAVTGKYGRGENPSGEYATSGN